MNFAVPNLGNASVAEGPTGLLHVTHLEVQ